MPFLQWHVFHDLRITFFCGTFTLRIEIKLQLRFIFGRHCEVFFITSQLRSLFVRCSYFPYDVRVTLHFGMFKLRTEVTLHLRFVLFVIVTYSLLHRIYVFYLFDVVTFSNDVRITFYFGMFELHMEITLHLRFVFVRHCDIFFITSQLRYLFVVCSYVFWLRYNYIIIW